MEYIERNNVFEIVNGYYIGQGEENERACACIDLWARIKAVPAADVVPVVRGEWIASGKNYACSNCKGEPYYCNDIHALNYCPYCGADMRQRRE